MRVEDFGTPSDQARNEELLRLLCMNYDSVLDLTLKFIEDSLMHGRDPIETVQRAREILSKAREVFNK
jgi:hypothetical protein